MDLKCIITECDKDAVGIVCVNMHDPEITVFMIPACTKHGEEMKVKRFLIQLNLNEPPEVEFIDGAVVPNANLTLRFEAFSG